MKYILDFLHALITRHEGLRVGGKYRVIYPDGKVSGGMPFGNAYDYREMFGGKIEKIENQSHE